MQGVLDKGGANNRVRGAGWKGTSDGRSCCVQLLHGCLGQASLRCGPHLHSQEEGVGAALCMVQPHQAHHVATRLPRSKAQECVFEGVASVKSWGICASARGALGWGEGPCPWPWQRAPACC